MTHSFFKKAVEQFILPGLENLPVVTFYAKTRGWFFVITWIHRITGVLLVIYVWMHIYTLSLLITPVEYDSKMKPFGHVFFTFLEWLLAVPVVFHAFNGGRLILYEIYGSRNNECMLRIMFVLSAAYVMLQALLMMMGNQSVSPIFFWSMALIFSSALVFSVATQIRSHAGSARWKLQRISGSFLLIMLPAHLLFMHLQPAVGHEAGAVIARMQIVFIKIIDLMMVVGVLYHAGYGLISVSKDYIKSKVLQNSLSFLIIFVMAVFGWIGVRLTLII